MKKTYSKWTNKLALVIALAVCSTERASAAEFLSLGDLPGGAVASEAWGVSLDGNVVVGKGTSAAGEEAFRWTQTGGMESLGDLPGGVVYSAAYGVSMDGKVVVGQSNSAEGYRAFRWVEGMGMANLGSLPGWENGKTVARGVSADGKVVAGTVCDGWYAGGYYPPSCVDAYLNGVPFRWTESGGMMDLGPYPDDATEGDVTGITADGLQIVGLSSGSSGHKAFFWDAEHGITRPAWLTNNESGFNIGHVSNVAPTGVALAGAVSGQRLWTLAGTTGVTGIYARAASADGTVFVGSTSRILGGTAKIWGPSPVEYRT